MHSELTPEKVLEAVCEVYNITIADLKSRKRSIPIPEARCVVAFYLYNTLEMTLSEVSPTIGEGHYSKVRKSISKYLSLMSSSWDFKNRVLKIENIMYENRNK
jgi:chromosomal replication initiator protein